MLNFFDYVKNNKIIQWTLISIFIILLIFVFNNLYNYLFIEINGLSTKGKVIGIYEEQAEGKEDFFIKSQTIIDGKDIYHEEVCFFYECPYVIGDSINLIYTLENRNPIRILYEINHNRRLRDTIISFIFMLIIATITYYVYKIY